MFKIENILSYYRCVFTKPDDDYQIMMNKTNERTLNELGKKDVNRGWLNYLKVTNKTDGRTNELGGDYET